MNTHFDVIVIGGSYAGLSAGLALGRSLRTVLIIDSGKPCNRFTPHSQNFLTHDGEIPADIAAKGRKDLQMYETVTVYEDMAITATIMNNNFVVQTDSGTAFTSRKIVIATGLKDILPDIEGLEACWGNSVIHCPYCHGYEFAQQPTAILANGNDAYHYAELVYNLTKDLVIFTNGPSSFATDQLEKIKKNDIKVIETPVNAIQHKDGQVQAVITNDGLAFPVNAVYHKPQYVQHSDIPETLGCEMNEQGLLKVDEFRQTNVKGVFACGDSAAFRSVATAVFTGSITGATVNKILAEEDFNGH